MNRLNTFFGPSLLLALVACGGENPDLFPEAPDGGELGTAEQSMSTRFSSSYTHGFANNSGKGKCRVGFAATGGCILPGHGMVRYKVTGYDPYGPEQGAGYDPQQSYKFLWRRALGNSSGSFQDGASAYGWPFGNAVEEDTASTWVEFTRGTCPDSSYPGSDVANNIASYVCFDQVDGLTAVTESQAGTYYRHTGKIRIKFDYSKARNYMTYIRGFNPGCVGGEQSNACKGIREYDWHEIVEHATHVTVPWLFGSGIYPSSVRVNPPSNPVDMTWSSPYVWDGGSSGRFSVQEYAPGELCRAGNWSSAATGEFTQASGSCPNN